MRLNVNKSIFFFSAILCLVFFLCLSPFDVQKNHLVWYDVFDAGHLSLFWTLTWAIYLFLISYGLTKNKAANISSYTSLFVSCVIEIIQPYFGRSESVKDIVVGFTGTLFARLMIDAVIYGSKRKLYIYLAFIIISQLALSIPIVISLSTLIWRDQNFPFLAGFETKREIYMWSANYQYEKKSPLRFRVTNTIASEGKHSLAIEKDFDHPWSGVEYDPGEIDISNYKTLSFDAFNPSEKSFFMNIRINDFTNGKEFTDRFNKKIELKPGWNKINIPILEIENAPASRKLDLKKIRKILFFYSEIQPADVMYLDNLKLGN